MQSTDISFGTFHAIFAAMLQQYHTGTYAQVVMAGFQSTSFPVDVGVKQGCVLSPIIINLFLVAITLVSNSDHHQSDSAGAE